VSEQRGDDVVRARLREMLDPVPIPDVVIRDVSRQVLSIPQRRPRKSPWQRLRAWVAPYRADDRVPPPEKILLAGSLDAYGPGPEVATPARRPLSVSVPMAMAAVAVLAVSGLVVMWTSPGFPLAPGFIGDATPTPTPRRPRA
jgi:hypothetical protein